MTGYAQKGERIEGESLELTARKVTPKQPTQHEQYGFCWPYKLSINSRSEIIESLSDDMKPFHEDSRLLKGDYLSADVIEVYCRKPLGKSHLRKASGKHKAKVNRTRGHSISEIVIPPRGILQKKKKSS